MSVCSNQEHQGLASLRQIDSPAGREGIIGWLVTFEGKRFIVVGFVVSMGMCTDVRLRGADGFEISAKPSEVFLL